MTTIAYRDGWLAADGQITRGDMVSETCAEKVRRLDDGSIVAFCGDMNQFTPFCEWYLDNTKPRPPMKIDDMRCGAIVLRPDGTLWDYDEIGVSQVHDKFAAWGSGGIVARAAMLMGASAWKAVEIACQVDIYSGGAIRSEGLKEWKS